MKAFVRIWLLESVVLVESKSLESLARAHKKQVLTLLKGNIERLVNELDELTL